MLDMETRIRFFLGCSVVITVVLSGIGQAQVIDDTTRQQLSALKKLCDEGFISSDVCKEKQRAILGLRSQGVARPEPVLPLTPTPSNPEPSQEVLPARVHESPLGFRLMLPAQWHVVDRQVLQHGFEAMHKPHGDNPNLKQFLERLQEQAVGERTEVFQKEGDVIVVGPYIGAIPRNFVEGEKGCRHMAFALLNIKGHSLTIYKCELRKVAGSLALYIERDAGLQDRRTIQYLVGKEPNKGIQLVLTSKTANLERQRQEFEEIVASVSWQ